MGQPQINPIPSTTRARLARRARLASPLAAGIVLACATAGAAWAQGSAEAGANRQDLAPITVEAQVEVHHKQVGTTYTGIPIEQVSLSREVRFTDLDLRTPNGRTMLNGRIESVARDACHQLQTLYPLEDWQTDNRTCVADAMRGARAQEHTILASMPHR